MSRKFFFSFFLSMSCLSFLEVGGLFRVCPPFCSWSAKKILHLLMYVFLTLGKKELNGN